MITIIYAHPNQKSYNHAILESIKLVLSKSKMKFKVIDLYNDRFDPVMKPSELPGSGSKRVASDVKKYQKIIKESYKLIFIYPTWWNSMPAILKGFIDRVFSNGFAYRYVGSMPKGKLKEKKALIITTSGGPRVFSMLMGSRNTKNLAKDMLKFCGIKTKTVQVGTVRPGKKHLKDSLMRIKMAALNFIGS